MNGLVFAIFVASFIATIYGQALSNDDAEYSYSPLLDWFDAFDWNVFKELAAEKKNFIFSPICLRIVLALLYQGSNLYTDNEYENIFRRINKEKISHQYHEILDTLVSVGVDHQVHIGSRIFLLSDLVPEQNFVKIAKDVFQTDIERTDLSKVESKKIVNDWVEKSTHGRMTQLMELDDISKMMTIIANIVYFKGTWQYEFPKNQTFLGDFNLVKDHDVVLLLNTVTVPYMTIKDSFYYYEDSRLNLKILRLPYKNGSGRLSMFIILPISNESLQTVLKKLNSSDIIRHFFSFLSLLEKKKVRVTLPKFRINSEKRLAETLQKFGMYQTFEETQPVIPADAVLITNYRVYDLIQKVGIEVEETGEKVTTGNKPEEVEAVFEATRPFLFFVQDLLGNMLLLGKVENPAE